MKTKISLVPSDRFVVSSVEDAVKLRTGSDTPGNYDPITAGYLPAIRAKRSDGETLTWTYRDYHRDVRIAARALLTLGVEESHGVCILGFNSPEWFIADLGAIYSGGNTHACQYVAAHCRANVIFVENEEQLKKILAVKSKLPALKSIVQYT
ncbi:Uncharacterized protein FKW44_020946, partial [Caligus rogercresseyi]